MENKHTPGPWKYSLNVGPTKALIVENDGSTVVELTTRTRSSRFEANARLIAAAPEMLEAIRAILFQVIQGKVLERDACITQARAAIAKAEGK